MHLARTTRHTHMPPAPRSHHRPESALQQIADNSPVVQRLSAIGHVIQQFEEEEPLQAIQRVEAEDALQFKTIQCEQAPRANNTGLPDTLKSGIEKLSGMAMDHVRVHRNSDKPAQVGAHAYAQGSQIHLAPGQERHLPHEAWHVVQQAQGRVKPTMQLKGVAVNDDAGLEAEADVMGAWAMQMAETAPIQRVVPPHGGGTKEVARTKYTPRGGKDTPYDKKKHPRGMFSFGVNTRYAVLENYNPVRAGNRIIAVQDNNGRQVNVEGIQLDHQTSWDTISGSMHNHNQSLNRQWSERLDYSLWDAKMYYNDLDNLAPALGALNASAGNEGVGAPERMHPGLEKYAARLHGAWMNLQAGLSAVGQGISDEAAEHVAGMLGEIANTIDTTTEALF